MKVPSTAGAGHTFAKVPEATIPRSVFNRSHGLKTTFNAGILYPIFVDEALPGDTFSCSMTALVRLATPLKPIMDNLHLETFFFAVPYRLVWSNFQKFMGEQESPGDSTDYVVPKVSSGASGFTEGQLADYFGLPIGVANIQVSALPFRAYHLIFNEWFRDQNLVDPVPVSKGDGPDVLSAGLVQRGKRHDYFTSSLPWPQKGTAVSVPLGGTAPVVAGAATTAIGVGVVGNATPNFLNDVGANNIQRSGTVGGTPLLVDLEYATAATINQWRQAFQVQRLLERDARGGTRYTELVKAHFGVTSPDARLQRPEYLGGGSTPIVVSPVVQNSGTPVDPETGYTDTPQGNLSAIGTGQMHGHVFAKSFTEHCILIGLVCVRADYTYQYGIDRMWSRSTRYDFYWPSLAHIGEQAVLSKEIYCDGSSGDDNVWGYQERYAEYRYKPSKVTGKFRSNASGSLQIWHLADERSTRPTLSGAFIAENPPVARIMAVPTEPHFLMDAYFSMKCARPMPLYGVPGMIDHF